MKPMLEVMPSDELIDYVDRPTFAGLYLDKPFDENSHAYKVWKKKYDCETKKEIKAWKLRCQERRLTKVNEKILRLIVNKSQIGTDA